MKRVVLVRPSGPRNVGMIARVCANFGPCELRLVDPERKSLLVHPDFEQMSHGVPDCEALCVVVPHLRAALEGTTFSVGFSGRAHDDRTRREWRGYASELALTANDPEQNVALVFGNEVEGLREDGPSAPEQQVALGEFRIGA